MYSSHLDGAFVEAEYVSSLWNWAGDVDKRIRSELGQLIDTLATSWSTLYPDLNKLTVTSGYRGIRRNAAVRGSFPHRTGKAIDIVVGKLTVKQSQDFLQLAIDTGFTGIGTYYDNPKRGRFHLDILLKREWRDGGGEQYTRFRKIFFTAGYNVPDYNESTSYSAYSP